MKNVECWGLTSFRGQVGLTPKNLPMGLKCYRSKFSDCCNVTHCQIVDQKLSLCGPIPQGVGVPSWWMLPVVTSSTQTTRWAHYASSFSWGSRIFSFQTNMNLTWKCLQIHPQLSTHAHKWTNK